MAAIDFTGDIWIIRIRALATADFFRRNPSPNNEIK
jgi:hypothetical protein